jgi:hypothetical protein
MIMFYGPQTAQMNKESPRELSLNLTLTLHPYDENPEMREVCIRLKIECP